MVVGTHKRLLYLSILKCQAEHSEYHKTVFMVKLAAKDLFLLQDHEQQQLVDVNQDFCTRFSIFRRRIKNLVIEEGMSLTDSLRSSEFTITSYSWPYILNKNLKRAAYPSRESTHLASRCTTEHCTYLHFLNLQLLEQANFCPSESVEKQRRR